MRKALVVDDSRLARVSLSRMLERRGFEVDGVESGEEALAYLETHTPEVVFMDYMMPQMSGHEATRAITGNPATARVPVVMCTSQDTPEDRAEAERSGARGFITKPASDQDLDEVLALLSTAPAAPAPAAAEPAPAAPAADLEATVRATVERLGATLDERLEQALAVRAAAIEESTRTLAARAAAEVEKRMRESIDGLQHRAVPDGADLLAGLDLEGRIASQVGTALEQAGAGLAQEVLADPRLGAMVTEAVDTRLQSLHGEVVEAVLADPRLRPADPPVRQPPDMEALLADPRLGAAVADEVSTRLQSLRGEVVEAVLADPRLRPADTAVQEPPDLDELLADPRLAQAIATRVESQLADQAQEPAGETPAAAADMETLQAAVAGARRQAGVALGAALVALALLVVSWIA
ncbi:response regulator [Thioalbus denitrificans]|uniref:Response regulator receiver domain-containing protein n=1 Tax=Thioalbus denitrificans TaxID=547122 RepID=A0A369CBH2_9GAMM|nr:response regulator [Thioalbus denitrificans]RCX31350.1 response regulator receiver domain-containing protein [Thioalbus denitrificans]